MASTPITQVKAALRAQDWTHALALIQEAKASPLGVDERRELRFAEAAVLRSGGRLVAARDIYSRLLDEAGPLSAARAEALHGLAECYLGVGDATSAERLAEASLEPAGADRTLRLRCAATHARAVARRDLGLAIDLALEEGRRPNPPGSARAHLRLVEAELWLQTGDHGRARRALGIAFADAQANDASRTLADVLRRKASVVILEGREDRYPHALSQLVHAERIYEGLGDRSRDLAITQRAELAKHRGQLARAARDFRRAAWLANERRDQLQVAHNLLGLTDTLRLAGTPDLRHLGRAEETYRRFDMVWGLFYCRMLVARAASDDTTGDAAIASARALLSERGGVLGVAEAAIVTASPGPLRLLFPR